jgi:hypothetical protein
MEKNEDHNARVAMRSITRFLTKSECLKNKTPLTLAIIKFRKNSLSYSRVM